MSVLRCNCYFCYFLISSELNELSNKKFHFTFSRNFYFKDANGLRKIHEIGEILFFIPGNHCKKTQSLLQSYFFARSHNNREMKWWQIAQSKRDLHEKISCNENFILIYNKRGLHHITKNKRQAEIVYDLLLRMIRKFRFRA